MHTYSSHLLSSARAAICILILSHLLSSARAAICILILVTCYLLLELLYAYLF